MSYSGRSYHFLFATSHPQSSDGLSHDFYFNLSFDVEMPSGQKAQLWSAGGQKIELPWVDISALRALDGMSHPKIFQTINISSIYVQKVPVSL